MKQIFYLLAFFPFILFGQDAQPFIVDGCLQLKGIVKKNCQILSGPSTDSYDRSVAEKFTVLYMFEHEGTSSALKNDFYRVGKSSKSAQGFVHKKDVAEWNHRLCLSFTDLVGARAPALVYPTQSLATERDWDTNKKPNKNAIGQEPTLDKDAKYDMLLPVLEEANINKKGTLSESMKAYRIGFLGETGGEGGESKTITKPKFKMKSKLDLMFLIDATGSMADEIVGAKQVVRNLTNTLKNMDNTEVRIGISLYKDYGSEFVSRKWQPLTTDYSRVLSKIADIEVSAGGDEEEAMYQGVLTTINTTNWSKSEQDLVLREILIIGDAPGHQYGGDYKVDSDDLITKASEERVRFIALNVGSNIKLEGQLTDLAEGLKDGDQGLYMEASAYTGKMTDDYLDKLSFGIKGEIERLQELEQVRSGVKRLEDVTPVNRAIFLKNLPSSGFDDIGVHFNEGWISEKNSDGVRQVEPYVYMTYGDLSKYKFFCQAAIATASAESADEGMVDLTTDKLTALSGETYDKETELDEHLRKTLCLPSSDSGILKYSLSEIFRWSPKRKQKFIMTIDDKVKILDQIIRDNTQWRNPDGTDLKYTFIKISLMP